MVDELEVIEKKIIEIMEELDGAYLVPVDQSKLSRIRASIIELLELVTIYLNKTYSPLTPWQKMRIVRTIDELYRDCLHAAIICIKSAIADPNTISPDNRYENEIIDLTFDDLNKKISIMKKYLR